MDKADVQRRVWEYLNGRGLSVRQFATRVGVSNGTLGRMLANDPTYQGKPEAWRRLARVPELGLTEAEVLAAVDLGPRPAITLAPLPPLQAVERALHAGPWKPEVKAAIFTLLRETAQA